MSDEKPKPVDDLKQGLNLLFRAAKGAVDKLPTDKIEDAIKDGAKEVGKAFETVANEVDKVFQKGTDAVKGHTTGASHPPEPTTAEGIHQAKEQHDAEVATAKREEEKKYDDAYAPEPPAPPRGPRIG